jgi:UDP-glucose 4-epimerase
MANKMSTTIPDLAGKKILVTGGLGFIGSNLSIRCHALGAEVTIFDTLDPHSGGNLFNVQPLNASVEIIINDIRNFEALCAATRDKDILFNCAAYTSHPNSMKEPLIDIDVNCKGIINILEAARRFNPEIKIVHIGTSTQIGRMQLDVIDERHPEFPVDIYSANKSVSEKYVLIYGSAYKMRTTVVRLANVFGPRSNIKSPEFGFMNYFVGLALQEKELDVFGSGRQRRNITYVEDCVDALILAGTSDRSDGQVFFAVSDRQATVAEIAEEITRVMGGKVRFVEWPPGREAIEIGDAVIRNDKIRDTLGWRPRHDLSDGLAKTRDYFSGCLNNYLR